MKNFSCAEISFATGGELLSGNPNAVFTGVDTDSRKIHEGSLFVPIVGEKFDGHEYIESSIAAGASGALSDRVFVSSSTILKVDDTKKALGDLAKWYLDSFNIPVVAITGSVGKTSTKEMVHAIMQKKFSTLKTPGNYNNDIGLPLSIFNMSDEYNAIVLEMGMSGLGEISRLSEIASPDIGIITNIGISHIEKLGSRQNILKAKLEIVDGMKDDGIVILNSDDPMLAGVRDFIGKKVITYGTEEDADIRAEAVFGKGEFGSEFSLSINGERHEVKLNVPGSHNVYNALAAIAVGSIFGISTSDSIEALSDFVSDDSMRMFIKEIGGIKIINDSYNASPISMKAALSVLSELRVSGKKYAVLGDILELGEWSQKAHIEVGESAKFNGIDVLVVVGEFAKHTANGASEAGFNEGNIHIFNNNSEVIAFLFDNITEGDSLLIKGSRGAKMEQVYKAIVEKSGEKVGG
ncbi:MAG: UDP-N-acetylmuramoyl-tripeptide--D-alanyl-D-alanine ligase [Bacillota bacterium]